ncbi:unnamed protein product [Linum trigynum]|uniref:NAC domain-containing protein n=1 Tax=Linum trigynum TaxID=586398 RepID=A0AAV2CPV7_9ROSI
MGNLLEESLPLGIGFEPTEADLLGLLKLKIEGEDDSVFDFFDSDPEDLSSANTKENIHCHDDGRVYVFGPPKSKVRRGIQINRDTPNGRWSLKLNSEIRNHGGDTVAMKGLYCFCGDEMNGEGGLLRKGTTKTPWTMSGFRLINGVDRTIGEEIMLYVVRKSTR